MGPYCASKFAVVAISESLHLELTMMGSPVKVSVLCPGWVQTNIAESERNWPARLGPPPERGVDPAGEVAREFVRQSLTTGMLPDEVAALVVEAIGAERFWVLTEHLMVARVVDRAQGIVEGRNPGGLGLV
jgi:short-subunit dehydrogenase